MKLLVDNWRWQGVPFYLRSGKAMSCATTQLVIQFRQPPYMLFGDGPRDSRDANRLVVQIQPSEGIQLHFHSKVPDAGMKLRMTDLSFQFRGEIRRPDAGGLRAASLGCRPRRRQSLCRADEVESAWGIVDPIQATWDAAAQPPLLIYEAGVWGPSESAAWMAAKAGRGSTRARSCISRDYSCRVGQGRVNSWWGCETDQTLCHVAVVN